MPALKPTSFSGRITWMGTVPPDQGMRAVSCDVLELGFDGPKGEAHSGHTRPSCSRVTSQHPRGTEIANVRQLSVVSVQDLAWIAAEIGLDAIDPRWLGATLVIDGIPDFTHVPPSSRMQGPDGVTLVVDMENRPCHLPAREIEHDKPGHGIAFKTAAAQRRGVTAWVERPGRLVVGDSLRLHIPDQPVWSQLEAARTSDAP
ncbi:MAG: MOSC domain-containing protein [Paracoccaceae bacterium]